MDSEYDWLMKLINHDLWISYIFVLAICDELQTTYFGPPIYTFLCASKDIHPFHYGQTIVRYNFTAILWQKQISKYIIGNT